MSLFLKQLLGIFSNAFIFYLLMKINHYDIKGLFKIYLRLAFIVALIGIIQEVSYVFKFKPGYDFRGILPVWDISLVNDLNLIRVSSILPEAFFFCIVMVPAFFVSIISFLKNSFQFQSKFNSVVIIVSFFLTFSVIGYFGAFFAVILLLYNNRKIRYIVVCAVIILGLAHFSYNKVGIMKIKIDNLFGVIEGREKLEYANISVYAFFSNALVAYNSFKDNPFFGHGLGSHPESYAKYVLREKLIPASAEIDAGNICKGDAGSLFIRLLSETGLFGILIFFGFIVIYYLPKWKDQTGYLWIINNAALSLFFLKILRGGNYFVDGFFFFFWLYYFSKIKIRVLNE